MENDLSNESMCPYSGEAVSRKSAGARRNTHWWPEQLNLQILNQHSPLTNPMGAGFN